MRFQSKSHCIYTLEICYENICLLRKLSDIPVAVFSQNVRNAITVAWPCYSYFSHSFMTRVLNYMQLVAIVTLLLRLADDFAANVYLVLWQYQWNERSILNVVTWTQIYIRLSALCSIELSLQHRRIFHAADVIINCKISCELGET